MPLTFRAIVGAACLMAAAGATAAGNGPANNAPAGARWQVPPLDAAAIDKQCPAEIAARRAMVRKMEAVRGAGSILAEWDRLSTRATGFSDVVYLLASVSTDAATRAAGLRCSEALAPLDTELFQSEKLYARVRALRPANAVDGRYRELLLEGFEDAGVALPADQRARVRAIRDEIETISLRFQANINEDKSTVAVTPAEAQGLPQAWLDARKRDPEGRLVVTLDSPTYTAFMENAVSTEARRAVYVAHMRLGGEANLALLDRVLALRHEMARIYGYPDFATLALRRSMAKTPQAVQDFLAQVRRAVDAGEAREIDVLRADKAALLGKSASEVKLDRWDLAFHLERVRRARYEIDQDALRRYFPPEASIAYAIRIAERLYGITFVARDVARWSPDVRYYDVFERTAQGGRGAFVGGVYLDLFPREGKYNHAAAFPVRTVSTRAGRTPVTALVANLSAHGLTYDDLETLMHEFGHVLHGVLSKARYADLGGTNVRRDFVEAPSLMFEEWGRTATALAVFGEVCPTCPQLSAQQIEQLRQSRRFGIGMQYARQWQYASFDMRIHTGAPPSPIATWRAIESASALGHVDGTLFPATFGHLVGGYAAGYYGYMWAQVLGLDMLDGFGGNLLDPAAGRRYRNTILAQGAQQPPLALVEAFLGRKPRPDAFFAEISGTRH